MTAQVARPQRFLPPTSSFKDLELQKPKSQRIRTSSPSSVRGFIDEETSASLHSSFKSFDSTASEDASTTNPKRVNFAPMVGVKDTISMFDMTDEEYENYWLSDDEYQYIRRRNRLLIKRAELFQSFRGKPLPASHSDSYDDLEDDIECKPEGDFLCVRGLESGTRKENIRKKTYRRNSIQQVLLEQELQSRHGCRDEEAIAQVYSEMVSPCKFRAVHLAMEDRLAATQAYWIQSLSRAITFCKSFFFNSTMSTVHFLLLISI